MNKYLLFGLITLVIFLALIGNVNAWSTNTFNNSLSTENLSLVATEWQTRWLNVPTNTYLINGYINLTGKKASVSSFITSGESSSSQGIATNGSVILISDSDVNKIFIYDMLGNYIKSWNLQTSNTEGAGITWNGSNWFVVDSLNTVAGRRIYKYDVNGNYLSNCTFGIAGAYVGLTTNNTFFWVSDMSGNTIIKTYMNCTIIDTLATGYMGNPSGVIIDNNNLYILDQDNYNITKMDLLGVISTNFSLNADNHYSYGITGYGDYFYTVDYTSQKVFKYVKGVPIGVEIGIGDTTSIFIPTGADEEVIFIGTNKSMNLVSRINSETSTCTCVDCHLITGFCQVPFSFRSGYSNGILGYDDLNFDNIGLIENNQTYSSTSSSSKSETFIINFSYDPTFYTSASGKLNYNNTEYTGTLSGSGNTKLLTASLTTPGASTSYPFYWNISLTNSSGINYFKSNNYTQTINPLSVSRCNNSGNGIFNTTFINFTVKDAENPTTLVPSKFKITFNYGIDNKLSTYSYQDLVGDNSSFPFCFLLSDLTYLTDAKIEYEATSYSKNYYYLNDASLTNATQNITLYLLNSSKATLTTLKAQTEGQTALEDVYIQIQRYDTGTDTYYTIGMAKTNYLGEDITYLNWYDTFYKYILTKDNSVIYIANTSKISSSPVTFTIPDDITFDYDKFLNIVYTLTFNNVTKNFVLTYSVPSGTITSACLRVDKRTIKNDTNICNTCETSSSATIYCNIDSYGNGTFIATFYAKGSLGVIDSIVAMIGVSNKLYNLIGNVDGTMYAILFSALCMVMFFISPVLGIVGLFLGMLAGMVIGFSPVNYMGFMGLGIVGVIIIMILKR